MAVSQPVLEISGLNNSSFSLLWAWAYLGIRKRRNIFKKAEKTRVENGLNSSFTQGERKMHCKA